MPLYSFVLLALLAPHVLSQRRAPVGSTPPDFAVMVPLQATVFDICEICLVVKNNPTTLVPACVAEALGGRVSDECGVGKAYPLHVIPGSQFNISIEYGALASKLVTFGLESSAASANFTPLMNVNPQAQGRSPFLVSLWIPPSADTFGGGNGLVYRYFQNETSSNYTTYSLRNITLDRSTNFWVAPPRASPSPSPSPPDSGSPAQSVWTYVAAAIVIGALLFTGIAWFINSRRVKNAVDNDVESVKDYGPPQMHQTTEGGNSDGRMPDLDDDDEEGDIKIVYKKSVDGGYTASVSSGRSSTSGNRLQSILKNRQQVEDEMVTTQMYDVNLLEIQQQQQQQHGVSTSNHHDASGAGKKVVFKETVEIAVEDSPALGPKVGGGLFGDSEVNDDSSLDSLTPHFNDGGVEKGMREVLRQNVLDDNESVSSDVSDGWRKEQ
ncbi:hypothetical protein BDR26DRAFT_866237 [Obelidium mucronatum]|nr:hypothetical protein BDR26DRAFT_866237 [Obelidium mucronatum]